MSIKLSSRRWNTRHYKFISPENWFEWNLNWLPTSDRKRDKRTHRLGSLSSLLVHGFLPPRLPYSGRLQEGQESQCWRQLVSRLKSGNEFMASSSLRLMSDEVLNFGTCFHFGTKLRKSWGVYNLKAWIVCVSVSCSSPRGLENCAHLSAGSPPEPCSAPPSLWPSVASQSNRRQNPLCSQTSCMSTHDNRKEDVLVWIVGNCILQCLVKK